MLQKFEDGETIFNVEFRKLGKTSCGQLANAARRYDSLLANRTSRSGLPTKFNGFVTNAPQFRTKQAQNGKFIHYFFQTTRADAKPGYDNVPTTLYQLQLGRS